MEQEYQQQQCSSAELALHDLFEGKIAAVTPASTRTIRLTESDTFPSKAGADARLAAITLRFNLLNRASGDWPAVDKPRHKGLQHSQQCAHTQ